MDLVMARAEVLTKSQNLDMRHMYAAPPHRDYCVAQHQMAIDRNYAGQSCAAPSSSSSSLLLTWTDTYPVAASASSRRLTRQWPNLMAD